MAGAGKKGPPRFFDEPKIRRAFINAIYLGLTLADACKIVGCDRSTVQRERQRDAQFARDVDTAESLGKRTLVEKIVGHDDWKAAAWVLERKHYQEYGRRDPDAISPAKLAMIIQQLTAKLVSVVPAKSLPAVMGSLQEVLSDLERD